MVKSKTEKIDLKSRKKKIWFGINFAILMISVILFAFFGKETALGYTAGIVMDEAIKSGVELTPEIILKGNFRMNESILMVTGFYVLFQFFNYVIFMLKSKKHLTIYLVFEAAFLLYFFGTEEPIVYLSLISGLIYMRLLFLEKKH